jgi:hypothetical protein
VEADRTPAAFRASERRDAYSAPASMGTRTRPPGPSDLTYSTTAASIPSPGAAYTSTTFLSISLCLPTSNPSSSLNSLTLVPLGRAVADESSRRPLTLLRAFLRAAESSAILACASLIALSSLADRARTYSLLALMSSYARAMSSWLKPISASTRSMFLLALSIESTSSTKISP